VRNVLRCAAAHLRDDEAGIYVAFTRKLRQQVLSGEVRI
jgi:hypothetical protein